MFVVFGFSTVFLNLGKPLRLVPALFIVLILIAGLLGDVVARFYSEPINRMLRKRWGKGTDSLGSAVLVQRRLWPLLD